MAKILAVGTAGLDIIHTVDGYPPEDAEVRALAQSVRCGGNAANTLTVLSQLGHQCTLAAVLGDAPAAEPIRRDLTRHGVDVGPCRSVPGGEPPISSVLLNRRGGSRTIVHYRALPEFDFADFRALDTHRFDWLHFEGRNVPELVRMLDHARTAHPGSVRSVEIEKPRAGIEALYPRAEWLLFSRAFARSRGFDDPLELLEAVRPLAPDAQLVCAWGEAGAAGLFRDRSAPRVEGAVPAAVVDTLGAGDVFNAGVIDAAVRGRDPRAILTWGCQLAGRKCGRAGLDGLAGPAPG